MDLEFVEILNIFLVLGIICSFNITCILFIHKVRVNAGKEVLFDRSRHLIDFANLMNFIESISNVLYATKNYLGESSLEEKMVLYLFGSYIARFYAICMGLRIYRIKCLHDIRAGNRSRSSSCQSGIRFNLIVANLYSLIATSIYIAIFYSTNEDLLIHFIRIIYGIESTLLLLASYFLFNYAKHPSIVVEYIFYSLIWITGCSSLTANRMLLIIPIRNSLLLLISLVSIYSHAELLRPCLPIDMTITDIFEIKEVFLDFQQFIRSSFSESQFKCFKLYKQIKFSPSGLTQEEIAALLSRIRLAQLPIDDFLTLDAIQDALETSLESAIDCYINSPSYKKMRKDYFIYFN